MKKKIISLFIVLTMILPNLIGVVSAEGTTATDGIHFWNSFSTWTSADIANTRGKDKISTPVSVVTIDQGTATTRVSYNQESNVPGIDRYVKLGKNYAAVYGHLADTIYHTASAGADPFSKYGKNASFNFEFDLKVKTSNEYVSVSVGNYSNEQLISADGQSKGTKIVFKNTGDIYVTKGSDSSTIDSGVDYGQDKWYRYRIVLNLTNATGTVGNWSLYRDGELIGNYSYKDSANAVNVIKISAVGSSNTTDTIDNKNICVSNLVAYMSGDNYTSSSTENLAVNIRNEKAAYDAYAANDEVAALTEYNTYKAAYDAAVDVLNAPYTLTAATDDYDAADNKYTQAQIDGYWTAVADAKTALDTAIDNANAEQYPGGLLYSNTYDSGKYDHAYDIGTALKVTCVPNSSGQDNFVVIDDENVAGGLVVHDSTSDYADGTFDYTVQGPNATLVTEFDIRFDDLTKNNTTFKIQMMDQSAFAKAGTVPVGFDLDDVADIEDGKWYRVRIEVYATDANGNKKTGYGVWVNGNKVVDRNKFGQVGGSDTSSYAKFPEIDSLKFIASGLTENGMTYSLDNVSMFKSNAANPMPVNDGALVSAIREWEDYLRLTGDSVVSAALTAAKAAYRETERTQTTVDAAKAALDAAVAYGNLTEDSTPYVIEGFKFVDADGVQATEPVEGGKLSHVILSQDGKYTGEDKLLVAAYNENVLADAKLFDIPESSVGSILSVATNIAIPAGAAGKYTYKAYIWNSTSSLKPLSGAFEQSVPAQNRALKIHVIGDSIATDYTDKTEKTSYDQTGWSETLDNWFNEGNNVTVQNHAVGGYSSKQFYNNLWTGAKKDISKGDYVFIAFMHNDQKENEERATDANSTYKEYLNKFIREARELGAIPVLVTSIPRLLYSGPGNSFSGTSDMGAYPGAMKDFAAACGVPCLDTFSTWAADVKEKSFDEAKIYYIYDKYKEANPDAGADRTHINSYGADVLAGYMLKALKSDYASPFKTIINANYQHEEPVGE